MTSPAPYPLRLRPILYEKIWGGRHLERLGKSLPPGARIGESWELADMPATSASGAGGAAARSIIENGALQGSTLHDALELWGRDLLGDAAPTPGGDFPLLVKFLDARENLSVQVHPSAPYVAAHPGVHLKTECWLVLDAGPGALIYKGVRRGVTPAEFARLISEGRVVEAIDAVPAVRGECHLLPSGTVHALGAGTVVAEVQTPSDTTFRVFDWGRAGRALHVTQALESMDFGPVPAATRAAPGGGRLASTPYFTVDISRVPGRGSASPIHAPGATVVVALAGAGILLTTAGETRITPGVTVVIPAALSASVMLRASEDTGAECLSVGVGSAPTAHAADTSRGNRTGSPP